MSLEDGAASVLKLPVDWPVTSVAALSRRSESATFPPEDYQSDFDNVFWRKR
jgi:hypothetical protein